MTKPAHTPGPYSAIHHNNQVWMVVNHERGLPICTCVIQADAERIAYCLRIVEESEATDERAKG